MKTDRHGFEFSLTPIRVGDQVDDGLIIYPGEPSEVVLQIKNLRRELLQVGLNVTGDFPPSWCQLGVEGEDIPAAAQMDALLYFQVPESFFEDQQALDPGQWLQLDYRVLVTITNLKSNTEIEQTEFYLHVRPRSLYLNFLPQLYRESSCNPAASAATSSDLMSRFLKIFEQAFEPTVHSLDAMWANLDPLTAPKAMLPFLAHWVGWTLEPGWELAPQRRMIRQAMELYRWRGTRRGLRLYLHSYTGLPLDDHILDEFQKHIGITEPFGDGFILGEAKLDRVVLGSGQPYHFHVCLRVDSGYPLHRLHEPTLHQIIQQAKPAFSTYDMIIEQREISSLQN